MLKVQDIKNEREVLEIRKKEIFEMKKYIYNNDFYLHNKSFFSN